MFSIDGHSMTIIEVDGVNHQPLTVDSLQIFAAQRYSFVLHANQPINNYWVHRLFLPRELFSTPLKVRANPSIGNAGFTNGINSGILRYVGARKVEPTTTSSTSNLLVETSLHPLVASPVPGLPHPGGADVNINLKIDLNITSATTGRFLVNGAVSFLNHFPGLRLQHDEDFPPA